MIFVAGRAVLKIFRTQEADWRNDSPFDSAMPACLPAQILRSDPQDNLRTSAYEFERGQNRIS
jgi:hypothetical protein